MTSPQSENGHVRIANELYEAIYKTNFNATQLKIIMCVIRYTYGFNRDSHSLSLSFISNAISLSKRYVSDELKKLIESNVILVVNNFTVTKSREIKINNNYSEWEGCRTIQQVKDTSTDEDDFHTTDEHDFTTTDEVVFIQERQIKNKYKDNDFKSVFDYYISLDLIKHRTYTKDMVKAITKAVKDNKYDIEYCKTLLLRHKTVVEKSKDSQYPVKVRGFAEFFGQKVYGATHLICSEYEEGGKYYEQYIKNNESVNKPAEIKNTRGPLKFIMRDNY